MTHPELAAEQAYVDNAYDQLDRMRHACERVLSQVQEISNVLLKAQAEAMDILNRCASANMEAFGGMAPDIAKLQQGAVSAMQAATSQVTAAIEEMRRRMSELEGETRQATGGTAGGDGGPAPSGRGRRCVAEVGWARRSSWRRSASWRRPP